MEKKLYRSTTDKKIAGVCGGIAQYFGIDSTIIRLAFVIFCLMGGSGVLVYIICALVMKEEPSNGGYTPYQDVNGQNNGWNDPNGQNNG